MPAALKQSSNRAAHLTKWKPGQSGNPRGSQRNYEGVAEIARRFCPEMIRMLRRIAVDKKQPAASRVSAAALVLDRGLGKAPSFSTTDINDFRRATEMSDEELIRIAQSGGITLDLAPVSRETKSLADQTASATHTQHDENNQA